MDQVSGHLYQPSAGNNSTYSSGYGMSMVHIFHTVNRLSEETRNSFEIFQRLPAKRLYPWFYLAVQSID